MTFPSLSPTHGREFEHGLGDEVEELLFTLKMGALGKLVANPKLNMEDVVKQDLQEMLKQAQETSDIESIKIFQSALGRVSRVD